MSAKLYIAKHFRRLYKFGKILGLVRFQYDFETNRLHEPGAPQAVYHYIVCRLAIVFLALAVYLDYLVMVTNIRSLEDFSAVKAHQVVLVFLSEVREIITSFCYFVNFVNNQELLMEIVKSYLKIYKDMREEYEVQFKIAFCKVNYYLSCMHIFFLMELPILLALLKLLINWNLKLAIIRVSIHMIPGFYGQLMPLLLLLSYQLCFVVLVGYYACLNTHVDHCMKGNDGQLRMASLLRLIYSMYCLRAKLNKFYSWIVVAQIIQLLSDGNAFYVLLELLIHKREVNSALLGHVAQGITGSYFILLVGIYSHWLCTEERLLQENLFSFKWREWKCPHSRQSLDSLLLYSRHNSMAVHLFGHIRLEGKNAWQLALNMVVLNNILRYLFHFNNPHESERTHLAVNYQHNATLVSFLNFELNPYYI